MAAAARARAERFCLAARRRRGARLLRAGSVGRSSRDARRPGRGALRHRSRRPIARVSPPSVCRASSCPGPPQPVRVSPCESAPSERYVVARWWQPRSAASGSRCSRSCTSASVAWPRACSPRAPACSRGALGGDVRLDVRPGDRLARDPLGRTDLASGQTPRRDAGYVHRCPDVGHAPRAPGGALARADRRAPPRPRPRDAARRARHDGLANAAQPARADHPRDRDVLECRPVQRSSRRFDRRGAGAASALSPWCCSRPCSCLARRYHARCACGF